MARILALSSQVARGHVGLSVIVPALQALGHEVTALPTVVLSNHPGHGRIAGERTRVDLLQSMLDALAANGWLAEVDAVLTGYLPSAAHVAFAVALIDRVRALRPDASILVDPIVGDWPKGVYIEHAAAEAVRDLLVPKATTVKLNAFELGWLTGTEIQNETGARDAMARLGVGAVVATSVAGTTGTLSNILVKQDAGEAVSCPVSKVAHAPHGTGDLLSALLLGHMLLAPGDPRLAFARAVAGTDRVVRASQGHDELCLVTDLPHLRHAPPLPLTVVL